MCVKAALIEMTQSLTDVFYRSSIEQDIHVVVSALIVLRRPEQLVWFLDNGAR
jgi:hypothetical protein